MDQRRETMRYVIIAVVVFAQLALAHADDFHLTDATGKKYGPFEFKQGTTLSIAGKEYTITKVLTKEQKILEKMKTIIIPEIEFRQANVHDAIAFLQSQSAEFDRTSERRQRGVSFVFNPGSPSATPTVSAHTVEADPWGAPPVAKRKRPEVPLITFSARDISLLEVINIVCKVSNQQWTIQDGVVMVEPKKTGVVQQKPAP